MQSFNTFSSRSKGVATVVLFDYLIAELLGAEGARAEPHALENLVSHRSKKFWLSRGRTCKG